MNSDNVVFQTLDFMEATMIRSLLEGSGVEVHVYDENISRLNPIYSHVVGGIKLLVPDEQVEWAQEILIEYAKGEIAPEREEGESD